MKRRILFAILVLIALLTMTSCLTSALSDLNSERIEFNTYCYATKIAETTTLSGSFSISKSNGVLVFIPSTSFQSEMILERALQKEFERKGIHCEIVSDYYNLDGVEKEEERAEIFKKIYSLENKERWGYDVEVYGYIKSCNTYTTGGGVASFEINYSIYYDFEDVATISVACESERNTLKGFRETLEVASKEMASEVVEKYLNYLK